jgi:hypothetical protein
MDQAGERMYPARARYHEWLPSWTPPRSEGLIKIGQLEGVLAQGRSRRRANQRFGKTRLARRADQILMIVDTVALAVRRFNRAGRGSGSVIFRTARY